MQTLATRSGDQPFVEATTVSGKDRVYVGYNGNTTGATIDESLDAATAPPPAGFNAISVDVRNNSAGPKTRTAIHADGTIYGAFYSANGDGTFDVVVVKDLNGGTSMPPYQALINSGDHNAGVIVDQSINADPSGSLDPNFGNDRRGWELAIAVDPNDDQRVYLCYSKGTSADDYTLHLRRSIDGGQNWLANSRTIVKAKNPGVAINEDGDVGFLYQQVTGPAASSQWVSIFERSSDDFATLTSNTLAQTSATAPTPSPNEGTYIGDYVKVQSFGKDFFGTFCANNTPDPANFPSGITYQRNADMTTHKLFGNDGVTQVPISIDPFFFSVITQDCIVTTDRDTYGKDDIDAMIFLNGGNPAIVDAAFYVAVDGFRHTELNITAADLAGTPSVAPSINFSPGLDKVSAHATALSAHGGGLVSGRQRFTWTFAMRFDDTSDFIQEIEPVTMTASITSTTNVTVSGQGVITLTLQPDPYEIDGPVSWLSVDLQVFNVLQGGALPNTPSIALNAGPNDFIHRLLANSGGGYNDPSLLRAPNHPFDLDLVANEDTSAVELGSHVGGTPVFNFAVARVRYRALSTAAANVRVFFRLFQASTTSTDFQSATTYLTGGLGGSKIPLLGVVNNEVVTIPFFASARVDPTNPNGLNAQPDPDNVGPVGESIPPDSTGNEVQVYFGCWLDINQNAPVLPSPAATGASPFTPVQSIQDAIRGKHQCLVAEIDLDPPEPQIATGATPANSDKLAQRNLNIVPGASPHRIPCTFDIKPTPVSLRRGQAPNELLIDWSGLPQGSKASIFLPGLSADEIIAKASRLYTHHGLSRADDHTLACKATGITYVPVPPGIGSNYAGLLTVDLPHSVKRGQSFKVIVRQVTDAFARPPAPPPPPPRIRAGSQAVAEDFIQWRRVLGTFQVSIPISTRRAILAPEERLLSVMRWIYLHMAPSDRWYPVIERYLDLIAGRVSALGGDPGNILPSPTGEGRRHHPPKEHERRRAYTGKIASLIFDRFGDFEGFTLDTEDGDHTFSSRERDMATLAERAWAERLRITVWAECDENSPSTENRPPPASRAVPLIPPASLCQNPSRRILAAHRVARRVPGWGFERLTRGGAVGKGAAGAADRRDDRAPSPP